MGYGAAIATAIGAVTAAAGTAVSVKAARDSRKAANNQILTGLRKQEEFQKQASGVFGQSLEDSGPKRFKKSQAEGEAEAQSLYQANALPASRSALPVDSDRLKLQVKQSRETSARGEGYQEGFNRMGMAGSESRRRLGVISNMSGSSANANQILTSLAANKGADMAGIGSLLSTAGSLAGIYGASKLGQAAAAGGGSPPGGGVKGGWSNSDADPIA